ncbi:unnamed protein product [Amoebophrya sp. A25]|nr:unnamed protein product [Amoebophrya sp. A25]|eukprot:GSA25T00027314001.1
MCGLPCAYASLPSQALGASATWARMNKNLLEMEIHDTEQMQCFSRLPHVEPPIFVWPVMFSTGIALKALRDDVDDFFGKVYKPMLLPAYLGDEDTTGAGRSVESGQESTTQSLDESPSKTPFDESTSKTPFREQPGPPIRSISDYTLDAAYVLTDPEDPLRMRKIRFARVDQVQHLSIVKHLLLHTPKNHDHEGNVQQVAESKTTSASADASSTSDAGQGVNVELEKQEPPYYVPHPHSDRLLPPFINQIVEFGGGTGELVSLVTEEAEWHKEKTGTKTGLFPRYIIYDTPPMTFFQKYFLRLSGIPALLASHENKKLLNTGASPVDGSDVRRHKEQEDATTTTTKTKLDDELNIYLLPSTEFPQDLDLFRHYVDKKALDTTLCFASFSLSEAPIPTRKRFLNALIPRSKSPVATTQQSESSSVEASTLLPSSSASTFTYGAYLFVLGDTFDSMRWDTMINLKHEFFDVHGFETCSWRMDKHGRIGGKAPIAYYFVAVRKGVWHEWAKVLQGLLGNSTTIDYLPRELRCEAMIGCTERTVVPELSTCRPP